MTKPTKEERLAHDTMQRSIELYPTHNAIIKTVAELVEGNTHNPFLGRLQHGREYLDDLIADLTAYRETLGTSDQYLKKARTRSASSDS